MIQTYSQFRSVTPSNTVDFPKLTQALWVGGAGDVAVVSQDGGPPVVFAGVAAGAYLPFTVRRVHATGTTATNIVALFQV